MELTESNKLVKVRGGYRALAKKTISDIQHLLSVEGCSSSKLLAAWTSLRGTRDKLLEFDLQVQAHLEEEDFLKDLCESDDRQRYINEHLNITEENLSKDKAPQLANKKSAGCDTCSSHTDSYRLEKIKLPTFSGNILEFKSFYQHFCASIHDNNNLKPIVKLQYLLGALRDNAKKLVSGFPVEEESYDSVLQTLIDSFDNPSKVIETHILRLININNPSYNYANLYDFKSQIQCHIRSLNSHKIGEGCEGCSILLGTILSQKLPEKLKSMINWEHPKDSWSLNLLQGTIDRALASLEAEGHKLEYKPANSKKSFPSLSKPNCTVKQNQEITSTVLSATQATSSKEKSKFNHDSRSSNKIYHNQNQVLLPCKFCYLPHYPSNCSTHPTVIQRRNVIKYRNWCEICLRQVHHGLPCENSKPCFKCGGNNHHVSICPQHLSSLPTPSYLNSLQNDHLDSCGSETVQMEHGSCALKPHESSSIGLEPLIGTFIRTEGGVALPLADLSTSINGKLVKIHSLLDQGAQCSLIHRSVVKENKLKPFKRIKMGIKGINKNSKARTREIVRVTVLTDDGSKFIDAVVVDSLPTNLYVPGLVETTQMLRSRSVRLADPYLESDHIDDIKLLIGSDHLGKFLGNVREVDGVNLQDSNIGSLLFGRLYCHSSKRKEAQTSKRLMSQSGVYTSHYNTSLDHAKISSGVTNHRSLPKLTILNSSMGRGPSKVMSLTHSSVDKRDLSHSFEEISCQDNLHQTKLLARRNDGSLYSNHLNNPYMGLSSPRSGGAI